MDFLREELFWVRQPKEFSIGKACAEIVTAPGTDLWQRTYYGFCNDNAPLLLTKTSRQYFSFTAKTSFDGKHRFDQCGVAVYRDGENWLKASAEYENERFQRLGSVVTNGGYSDWATTDIPASVREIWYRLSRRGADFCVEYSEDGKTFRQMRICRLHACGGEIAFGIYACSPGQSSFRAVFTELTVGECLWKAHES